MYIVLLPNHEWWAMFDLESAKYFAKQSDKQDNHPKIFKCIGPKQWEEIEFQTLHHFNVVKFLSKNQTTIV